MQRFTTTIILSILFITICNAQNLPIQLGKLGDDGKKEGYFKAQLSKDFQILSGDGAEYEYFGYYLGGELMFWVPPKWMGECKLQEVVESNETSSQLNGTYVFTREGKQGWKYTIKFKEGLLEYERIDFDESGRNYEEKFFRTKYNNIECSYYSVSESKGTYFKGYYYLENGKMKDNIRKIKVKDVSKRYKE